MNAWAAFFIPLAPLIRYKAESISIQIRFTCEFRHFSKVILHLLLTLVSVSKIDLNLFDLIMSWRALQTHVLHSEISHRTSSLGKWCQNWNERLYLVVPFQSCWEKLHYNNRMKNPASESVTTLPTNLLWSRIINFVDNCSTQARCFTPTEWPKTTPVFQDEI